MKTGRLFLIGLPIVFLVTSVSVGSLEDALGVMFLSIVCTAGVGLLFWVPMCILAGWLAVSLYEIVTGGSGSSPGGAPATRAGKADGAVDHQKRPPTSQRMRPGGPEASARKEVQVVADYITLYESRGGSREQAVTRLRENGWKESEIARAITLLEAREQVEHAHG